MWRFAIAGGEASVTRAEGPAQVTIPAQELGAAYLGGVTLASLADEDKTAVHKLFSLIAEVAREIAPSLQVILLDHADLKEDWFDGAVIERWRHGRKLVPLDWIDS